MSDEQPQASHIGSRLYVRRTVCLPPEMLGRALEKSKREQRSFSNYIQRLVAGDLSQTGKEEGKTE